MKTLKLLLCFLLMVTLFACNAEKKKLKQKITATETKITDRNIETLSSLAALYEEYADKFKEDKEAPLYLFKAAQTYNDLNNYSKSIELFGKFAERYPKSEMAGDALHTIGYIYENRMGDFPKAKAAYELFLKKYPHHELADDTRANLPKIGTTPDWVKDLEKADSINN